MVNMPATQRDVVERPEIVVNRERDYAHDDDGGEETNRGQEQPLSPRFREAMPVDLTQARSRHDRGEKTQNGREHERKKPKTRMLKEHGCLRRSYCYQLHCSRRSRKLLR